MADRRRPHPLMARVGLLRRSPIVLSVALKVALVGLLGFALLHADQPQFQNKAMTWRVVLYPVVIVVVPIGWWFVKRRRERALAYPFGLDVLVVLPAVIDTAGNAFDLYDEINWWDDFNHFFNMAILVAAFGQVLLWLPVGRLATAALAVGFGSVAATIWEFAEYLTFVQRSPEFNTAYRDTIGDLAYGLVGSLLSATVTAWILWPRCHRNMRAFADTEKHIAAHAPAGRMGRRGRLHR